MEVVAGVQEDCKFVIDGARLIEKNHVEWKEARMMMMLPFIGSGKT